jgi:Trypsin-like serine proteases, typically periplasmic, contain C-terminal PDZ domain
MKNNGNMSSITFRVVLFSLMSILLVTSCKSNSSQESNSEQKQVSSIEQVQVPIQRTAFLPTGEDVDFVNAAENSVNAVVHIKTEIVQKSASYNDFFGALLEHLYGYQGQAPSNTMVAYGSGVVLSPDGYIVTNNHVVEGADKVEVTFNNKLKKMATIVGTDPTSDLALIKVDGEEYDFLVFGDSDNVHIGEWVLAVGNPFNLTSTVTAGIVSAKARDMRLLGDNSTVESFIQTDAAVNRGNSGGALVNTKGELIGINAAIASHTGVYEGYSFAIPSNIVRKVVDDLLLYGETQRAFLGVSIAEMNAELAEQTGMKNIQGVYISEVPAGGAAADAGIRKGDVITGINGNKVNTITQLTENIRQYRPGDEVEVEFIRNNAVKNQKVILKNESGSVSVSKKGESFFNSELGLVLQTVNQSEKNSLNIKNGLKIVEIRQGVFQRGGMNENFVITSVNGQSVNSKSDLEKALNDNKTRKTRIEGVYPNGMKISFEFYKG